MKTYLIRSLVIALLFVPDICGQRSVHAQIALPNWLNHFRKPPSGGGGGGSFPTGALLDLQFNGNVSDSSGNGNTATVTGTATFTTGQDSVGSHAFSFNSSTTVDQNDATVADFTTQDFSISFWVNLNTGNLASTPIIVAKGVFHLGGYYFFINASGGLQVDFNQPGATESVITANGAITEGTWYHVVFVRTGSSGKIYKNGADITSHSDTLVNPDADGIRPFRIGGGSAGGFNVNGSVDEVAVWARALTGTEISNIYSLGAR